MQRGPQAILIVFLAIVLSADDAFAQGRQISTRSRFQRKQNTLSPYLELLNSNTTGMGYYRRMRTQSNQQATNQQLSATLLQQQQLLSAQQPGQQTAGMPPLAQQPGRHLSPSGVHGTFQNYRGYFAPPQRRH